MFTSDVFVCALVASLGTFGKCSYLFLNVFNNYFDYIYIYEDDLQLGKLKGNSFATQAS